ncbi:MAG: hypothetical protein HKP27_16875 [Myxococcales bacterium]|nr:hypothetical protein [Myxococcales bacterium]
MTEDFQADERRRLGDPFAYDESIEHVNTPLWREVLWPLDWMKLRFSKAYCGRGLPHGNGEPVLVIPGFLSNDIVMFEMHRWLLRIGYKPHASRIPFNVDCPNETAKRLVARIATLHDETGERVRLIGHSLGGMLARSLAQYAPEHTDRVITLGSPFRDLVRAHPAVVGLWDHIKEAQGNLLGRNLKPSCATGHCLCDFVKHMLDPEESSVPQFAVYSRKDGVAHWESCVTEDDAMNDEVNCTHVGMAFHPMVFEAVAHRLAETI